MKKVHYIIGIVSTILLIILLLITSVEIAVYGDIDYFRKEYEKYGVTETVKMDMEDLIEVTEEMLAYLRGDRSDLHITTTIDGAEREFFNERETAHMEDVQALFIMALQIRLIIVVIILCLYIFLCTQLKKRELAKLTARSFQIGCGVFIVTLSILVFLFSQNFTKYFVIFHQIFFTNDLWILDPATDLLINIVPEPFFIDTALRIAFIFGAIILILFIISTFYILCKKREEKES